MFSESFNKSQKEVFLDLLVRLIKADGVIEDFEAQRLNAVKAVFKGIDAREVKMSELAGIFPDRSSRISLLLELVSLPLSRGSVGKEERALLEEISNALKISSHDLGWMTMWAENMIFLFDQAKKFMTDAK